MTSYRQCDSYGYDILQRYHPNRQSYTRRKRNVSLVLGHQSMLITIFNTSDSQLQSSKMKGSFDQFTCLRINPFHLRKDMLIYTEFKSWVYCAATVEISSDTQILVAPQCAITDSLLNARKSCRERSLISPLATKLPLATAAAAAVNENDDDDNDSDNDDDDDGDDDDHDDVIDDDDDDDDVDDDDMYDTDNKAGDDAIHLGFSYHTHLS